MGEAAGDLVLGRHERRAASFGVNENGAPHSRQKPSVRPGAPSDAPDRLAVDRATRFSSGMPGSSITRSAGSCARSEGSRSGPHPADSAATASTEPVAGLGFVPFHRGGFGTPGSTDGRFGEPSSVAESGWGGGVLTFMPLTVAVHHQRRFRRVHPGFPGQFTAPPSGRGWRVESVVLVTHRRRRRPRRGRWGRCTERGGRARPAAPRRILEQADAVRHRLVRVEPGPELVRRGFGWAPGSPTARSSAWRRSSSSARGSYRPARAPRCATDLAR